MKDPRKSAMLSLSICPPFFPLVRRKKQTNILLLNFFYYIHTRHVSGLCASDILTLASCGPHCPPRVPTNHFPPLIERIKIPHIFLPLFLPFYYYPLLFSNSIKIINSYWEEILDHTISFTIQP